MATSKDQPEYQNNPFYVATDGLTLLFKKAQPVAILLIIISTLGLGGSFMPSSSVQYEARPPESMNGEQIQDTITRNLAQVPTEAWILIAVIGSILLLVSIFVAVTISGMGDYTAARLAEGEQVTIGEAFKGVMARFFGYLWLQILVRIKILLWTLLLIVPGIIMSTRYSLSGTAFFSGKLGAQTATKRSAHLTKGAWFTTFGAFGLFNMITLGLIQPLLQPGTSAVLFRQYSSYDTSNLKKPAAHILSWLTFFVPIVLGLLFLALVAALIIAFINFS